MLVTDTMNVNANFQAWRGAPMQRKSTGFTLIELMITLAIAAVLLTVALPSMRTFIENSRIKAASFDVQSALILARSEAIKRNADVTLTSTGGANWKSGWTITAGGATIQAQDAYTSSAKLAISGPASLVYKGTGRLSATVGAITVSSTGSSRTSTITISLTGLPNTTNQY
jgi:type IV fimbrial biogenesis protein FimT